LRNEKRILTHQNNHQTDNEVKKKNSYEEMQKIQRTIFITV